jgi:Flp pilus assembly pilin Flp
MKKLTKKITAFLTDEQGAETVEWVIVVAIVAGIGVTVLGSGGSIGGAITRGAAAIGVSLDAAR